MISSESISLTAYPYYIISFSTFLPLLTSFHCYHCQIPHYRLYVDLYKVMSLEHQIDHCLNNISHVSVDCSFHRRSSSVCDPGHRNWPIALIVRWCFVYKGCTNCSQIWSIYGWYLRICRLYELHIVVSSLCCRKPKCPSSHHFFMSHCDPHFSWWIAIELFWSHAS